MVFELPPDSTPTPGPKAVVTHLVGALWINGPRTPTGFTRRQLARPESTQASPSTFCEVVRGGEAMNPCVTDNRIAQQVPAGGTLVEPGSSIRVHVIFSSTCDLLPLTDGALILG
jgi:hypothetical protein